MYSQIKNKIRSKISYHCLCCYKAAQAPPLLECVIPEGLGTAFGFSETIDGFEYTQKIVFKDKTETYVTVYDELTIGGIIETMAIIATFLHLRTDKHYAADALKRCRMMARFILPYEFDDFINDNALKMPIYEEKLAEAQIVLLVRENNN